MDINEAVRRYNEGERVIPLAAEAGCSYYTMHCRLKRAGVTFRSVGRARTKPIKVKKQKQFASLMRDAGPSAFGAFLSRPLTGGFCGN